MKFIKLESRGGNYLVVAENIAWLRTAENGQTNVGIVGGQPLLVVGTIEEVAAKILADSAPVEPPAAAQPVAVPAPAPEPRSAVKAAPVAEAAAPAPEPAPELAPEPEPAELEPVPAPAPAKAAERPRPASAPERPRAAIKRPMSLSERIAAAAATTPKVKAGSQRFMGALD
jgi:outer membrane biosynthesis protein TonB